MFDRAIFELDGIKPMMAVIVALTVARALAVVGQAVGLAQAIVGVWQGNALEEQAAWIALFVRSFSLRKTTCSIDTPTNRPIHCGSRCFKPSSKPGLHLSASADLPPW